MKTVLAFDQATKMGWAVGTPGNPLAGGTIDTTPRRFDSLGTRFLRAEKAIVGLLEKYRPALVIFEEHRAHSSVQAAQILGGYTVTIMKCCEQHGVPYMAVPVATLKKFGSGCYRATKALMVATARKKYPTLPIASDDEADAAHMMAWGWKQL